jgi:hypothetical protein
MQQFKTRLLTLMLFLTLSSVQQFASPTLEVLPKDQMVAILVDLELAKAMVRYYSDEETIVYQWFEKNSLLIYQVHEINPVLFQRSYHYYLAHPEEMKGIYETVLARLEELKNQV